MSNDNTPFTASPANPVNKCELCPATFTRATHLKRHMRSHLGEKMYQCESCSSQFTRSDLLTRHRKSCGETRSRRKSCEACAKGKVRCDLQRPCEKCAARGINCVYTNAPRPPKPAASEPISTQKRVTPPFTVRQPQPPPPSPISTQSTDEMPHSSGSSFVDVESSDGCPSAIDSPISMTPPDLMSDWSAFEASHQLNSKNHLMQFLQSTMSYDLQDFHGGDDSTPFSTPIEYSNSINFPELGQGLDMSDVYGQSIGADMIYMDMSSSNGLDFIATSGSGTSAYLPGSPFNDVRPSSGAPSLRNNVTPLIGIRGDVTDSELRVYSSLFYSEFLVQMPLVHIPTWKESEKCPLLIRAIQTCGALFVKTAKAAHFVLTTLASAREEIIQEFTRQTGDRDVQIQLILAMALLQTVGLFHERGESRTSSALYHGTFIMMIARSSRFNTFNGCDFSKLDSSSLNEEWKRWALYESAKRLECLSYLHDCCQSIYFASPSFTRPSFDSFLPCDEVLWSASTAEEWLSYLQANSRYGPPQLRLRGLNWREVFSALVEQIPPAASIVTPPFASFILMHSILSTIWIQLHAISSHANDPETGLSPTSDIVRQTILNMQNAIHNWLSNWQDDIQQSSWRSPKESTPFTCDSLPFYWLAQASLRMLCENNSGNAIVTRVEVRFFVIKEWLARIRTSLQKSGQISAQVWIELMDLLSQYSGEGGSPVITNADHPDGLLAFFPEN